MRRAHILAMAVQWALLPMIAAGADWPQFRHDAGRTAASREDLPANLHLQWTCELPHPRPAFPDEVVKELDSGSAVRYSEAYDLLVTAGGIYKGVDGTPAGDTNGFDRMHGNQACGLLSLVDDKLLWGTATSYAAYDLLSGDEVDDAMTWVRRGCTGLRASTNLITTRYRGNCAYIDMDSREITPLWNVRPACNNNLFPADGILNIPCLTGGCECNYTPASQAYAPMSVIER